MHTSDYCTTLSVQCPTHSRNRGASRFHSKFENCCFGRAMISFVWNSSPIKSCMVKFHEDAYWPKNLSLFAIKCEHYWGPKNKIMRKSGIRSTVPYWDSALEQFLFYRVSVKNAKSDVFWRNNYSTIHLSKQHYCHKREAPRNIMLFNFFGHPSKQKLF